MCLFTGTVQNRTYTGRRAKVTLEPGEPLTPLEMYKPLEMCKAIHRKISLVAPTPIPPATEPSPLDSGQINDSDNESTSGKWPNKAFALFRLLLALPGPMFLLFTGTQYSRRDQFSGWTGSFAELGAGYTLGVQACLISLPPLVVSLLLAQIDKTGDALTTSFK